MKADSASHLVRHPISFELFLLLYLICALLLQKINIYKTNYHRMDMNLVVFIIVILGRRLAWCALQCIQARSKTKTVVNFPTWQSVLSDYIKGNLRWTALWSMLMWNWSLNVKRCCIVLCTIPAMLWSVLQLIQNTSIFNLLFLFYPLLLYFSLFGFTLEPRCYRKRYEPPKTFLEHINLFSPTRQTPSPLFASLEILTHPSSDQGHSLSSHSTSAHNSSLHSRTRQRSDKSDASAYSSTGSQHHFSDRSSSSQHHHHRQNTSKDRSSDSSSSGRKGTNHIFFNNGRLYSGKASNDHTRKSHSDYSIPVYARLSLEWRQAMCKYGPDYYLLLPLTPDEVRGEMDMLMSDMVVRLKQLLFNSLLCAYYVGFIPMQFADRHLYYDKWWCVEHTFLVWANSFVILSSHLLPPSYCQLLYQCSLHLGCWTRCSHVENAHIWSPDVTWLRNKVVQWNGELFRAEGPQNVAIPGNSSQEFFYVLFHSRLHVHSWLLTMQIITVAFQIVILLRSIFWFQTLSMSVLLVFNYFILYKLLFNRLWCRQSASLS